MSARKEPQSCQVCKHTPEDQDELKDLGSGPGKRYPVCKDVGPCVERLMNTAVPVKPKPARKPRARRPRAVQAGETA